MKYFVIKTTKEGMNIKDTNALMDGQKTKKSVGNSQGKEQNKLQID